MQPFAYQRAGDLNAALAAGQAGADMADAHARSATQFIAGGTTLLDLAKLNVMQPGRLVDINPLQSGFGSISADAAGLKLGALVRMSEAEDHAAVKRDYPVIAQSLMLAASPQLRNMASLGGNVLQRTRCSYFRDAGLHQCNKREPGTGCAAIGGVNRELAVLGTSQNCIANYAGDFAQSLIALDATVDIAGPGGPRVIRFEDLHTLPGNTPHIETSLKPGEIITGFTVPAGAWTRRSLYLKIRDRESYAFALASAAVALEMDGAVVKQARIALGGLASVPWRARQAEAILTNQPLNEAMATKAAAAAFADARGEGPVAFKIDLGRRTLVRALMQAQAIPT